MAHRTNNMKSKITKGEFMRKSYQKKTFCASMCLMNKGKFLGIDYGGKRVGIAVSDENGVLSFPKTILPNDSSLMERISKIFKNENIAEIVVGESLNFKGEPNEIKKEADVFIKKLEENLEVLVHREKEFLTTVEARRYGRNTDSAD